MQYPRHIHDETRHQLAEMILEKELTKLLPDISDRQLAETIRSWQERPRDFHLEESVRDFWNIFAAVIESIKLKPSFTAFVTAKNYHWQRKTLPVLDIQLSSKLAQLERLKELSWQNNTTVGDVMQAITSDEQLQIQRTINDSHSTEAQTAYPIIVRQLTDGSMKVMDGNRRSLRAGLYGQASIDAWVATADDPMPIDHWVPVNDLFQIVKLYSFSRSDVERQSVRNSLEIIFRQSEVARITYQTRVTDAEDAKKLLKISPSI